MAAWKPVLVLADTRRVRDDPYGEIELWLAALGGVMAFIQPYYGLLRVGERRNFHHRGCSLFHQAWRRLPVEPGWARCFVGDGRWWDAMHTALRVVRGGEECAPLFSQGTRRSQGSGGLR